MSQYPIRLVRGADFRRQLTYSIELTDGSTEPVDLTGAEITSHIVRKSDSEVVAEFDCMIVDGVNGVFDLRLTHETTAEMDDEDLYSDVKILFPNGTVRKFLKTQVIVAQSATM